MNYASNNYKEHRKAMQTVDVEGGKLAFLDTGGSGPTVMLVHGVPTSSWLYRKMITPLQAAGLRVIAPDLLGYGFSQKPKLKPEAYDPPAQGRRLVALMDHLGLQQWNHVCHDAGGIWTFEMMAAATGRVLSLTFLNTIVFREGFKPPMTFRRGHFLGKAYVSLYRNRAFCKTMIKATMDHGLEECNLSRDELRGYWQPMSEGTDRALYSFFTGLEEVFGQLTHYQDMLRQAAIPAMTVWGKDDEILLGDVQVPLIAELMQIPEERRHLIDGCKHFIQEEKPEEVAALIAAFIPS